MTCKNMMLDEGVKTCTHYLTLLIDSKIKNLFNMKISDWK